MRILNDDGDALLRAITLYLTPEEAVQLGETLHALLGDLDDSDSHGHLWDGAHEIMLVVRSAESDADEERTR